LGAMHRQKQTKGTHEKVKIRGHTVVIQVP